MIKYKMNSQMQQQSSADTYTNDVADHDRQANVKVMNNQIWLYDDISDKSLYKLKQCLLSVNQTLDMLSIQYMGGQTKNLHVILHIASNGGCVFSGMNMYDTIKNNKYPVFTFVQGFVASAATFPLLGGVKRYISENSFIMIHQISTWFTGTFDNLKDEMKNMQKIMQKVKNIYLKQLSIQDQRLQELISKDLWLSREQSVQIGFTKQ